MEHQASAPISGFSPAWPPFGPDVRSTASVAAHLQAEAVHAMMRCQIEFLSFLNHRYEKDFKLIDDLITSQETGDSFEVLGEFMQSAVTEYATEAGKLARINSRALYAAADRIRDGARVIADDMSAATVG
ncbi:phasin family protein [Sinorhizobium sp. BG8]|uniref:phasin family protein n=1 Tax=Sinorhizobium sp. BG8 TaxID=2613773 RepID=UPI00193EAC83|nr:phasin family protein [Sinorhizobium sp. BG8]QRM53221.1 phasin family protein [Sinorhizobium sp. BG8]